jgi:hypothetical protein
VVHLLHDNVYHAGQGLCGSKSGYGVAVSPGVCVTCRSSIGFELPVRQQMQQNLGRFQICLQQLNYLFSMFEQQEAVSKTVRRLRNTNPLCS